jgi:flagellin
MTMLSINTNVGALKAASASYSVNKSMETSMQRLSTGKRINSAADDAAGDQIQRRLTSEIQGLKQAIRNAADAQALMGTAEGAIEEIQLMLLRMRQLAVQSSNSTNSTADRASIELEGAQLEAEISRIANNTTFAGENLLDGSFSGDTSVNTRTFQIGADSGQTIELSIPEMTATAATISYSVAVSLDSFTSAQTAITVLDGALSNVAVVRANIGAKMNRLDHTIANLDNVVLNLEQAKGRIVDADFAVETANLARTQVLQQASMAMLSQANASKQNILSLFQ